MSLLRTILTLNLALVFLSCSTINNNVISIRASSEEPKFGAETSRMAINGSTIRLLDPKNRFYCTGFVVDANYALTAAHCVTNRLGGLNDDPIIIANEYGTNTGVVAKAVAVEGYRDVAFIKGNFKDFQSQKTDFYGEHVKGGVKMISCGFPAGMYKKFCTELIHVGNKYFQFRTVGGPIYKGMSGGPVINEQTGVAIGVNSAVDVDTVIIGPLVGVLKAVGLE